MNFSDILKNKAVQTAAISAVTFASGAVFGYIIAKRKYNREYETTVVLDEHISFIIDDEPVKIDLESTDIPYEVIVIPTAHPKEFPTIEKPDDVIPEPEKVENVNRYLNDDHDDWDYEIEMNLRTREIPYILHRDEFFGEEMGYRQESLTYYSGDDIMADTDDSPIYGYEGLMGELKFGHGSGDENIVYIRNEVIHMEWEIILHPGMFSEEILGLQMEKETENELHHSVLKFRRE